MECGRKQKDEADIDALAEEIAEAIPNLHNDKTNPNNSEFGALILRLVGADGEITYVRTGIGRSHNSTAIGLSDLYALAQRMFPGIDGSNVVRVVHSHTAGLPTDPPTFRDVPDITHLDARDFFNTLPSHPNTTRGENDWVNTEQFLRENGLESTDGLAIPFWILMEY